MRRSVACGSYLRVRSRRRGAGCGEKLGRSGTSQLLRFAKCIPRRPVRQQSNAREHAQATQALPRSRICGHSLPSVALGGWRSVFWTQRSVYLPLPSASGLLQSVDHSPLSAFRLCRAIFLLLGHSLRHSTLAVRDRASAYLAGRKWLRRQGRSSP